MYVNEGHLYAKESLFVQFRKVGGAFIGKDFPNKTDLLNRSAWEGFKGPIV